MARIGESADLFKCSFCGKSQKQVQQLIAGPGVYISNTSVVGLVQRVVMRAVTVAFLTGSTQLPVRVQAIFSSQLPLLSITPVLMLSFHVDQCSPVTLS